MVMSTIDLTRRFGEGWCVTVADLPAEQMLIRMGVSGSATVPDGPEYLTARLIAGPAQDGEGTAVAARDLLPDRAGGRSGPVAPVWALGLELDGTAGWVGEDLAVLGRVSASGGRAVTICSDPNRTDLRYAEDGRVQGGLDAISGRSWTSLPSCPPMPEIDGSGITSSQRAVLALRSLVGVTLDDEVFAGQWLGGLAARPLFRTFG
jgi:hypothetical protein